MFAEGLDVPVGCNLDHTLNGVGTAESPHYPDCRKEKVRLALSALLHTEAYKWEA